MTISLKMRLSLLHLLLLMILLSIFSYGIFTGTRNFLIQNTAVRLRAQAKPVIDRWMNGSIKDSSSLSKEASLLAVDLTSRDTAALVMDKAGVILAKGKRLPSEPVPAPPNPSYFSKSLSGENEITYITKEKDEMFLVTLIPLRKASDPSKVVGIVQLSTSLSPLNGFLNRQKTRLILGILLILTAGALIGFWITYVSLKELTGMVETCNQIAAGNLSKRINLPRRTDEIGQLADAFNNMIKRIEELFETQARFVANAAHELRTPLSALQGSLEVLMRGAQDDPQASRRLTQGMYREITRLTRMCEQLLDLTRITKSTDIHKEKINIKSLFNEFLHYAEIMAEGRKIVINGSSGLVFTGNPDFLKQILFNLTDNAVQHTEQNEMITFTWKQSESGIIFSVSDNGCGISPEDLPHIFEPFYRGDPSRSRRSGGTGLGLAIVKNLVEANGGHIKAESILLKKTVITFSFPST